MREIFFKFFDEYDEFKTEDFEVSGLNYFSIIRNRLFFIAISDEYKSPATKSNSFASSILIFFKMLRSSRFLLKKKTALGISHNSFRTNLDNTIYDKALDPLLDIFGQGEGILVEMNHRISSGNEFYKNSRILPLNFIEKIASKLFKKEHSLSVDLMQKKALNELIENFCSISSKTDTQKIKRLIKSDILKFFIWIRLSRIILNLIKPKFLFTYSFSSVSTGAFIAVANSMKIKTIDIQHGPVGWQHFNYRYLKSNNENIIYPEPKFFFVWDKYSFNIMSEIIDKERLILAGNRWHKFILDLSYRNEYNFQRNKKYILYTLQPVEPIIEDFIMEAIERSKEDFIWLIRYHPRMNDQQKKQISDNLEKFTKIGVVSLDYSNNTALPEILLNCDVHITKYSGSTLEACSFKVPTVIINLMGYELYKNLEGDQLITFELNNNSENLLKSIKYLSVKNQHHSNEMDFISMNMNIDHFLSES
ncbi:hypothetical protein [Marivirga arenosa]|uniref:Uncharacterized protein n=1 Tax=Marivirga arenosa TaxID=3059076 RepID=A0AA51ZS90_9BACT|nr:hypothetical protein [Marivirga sp. BKB1-2]WNB16855.1 hypothetical protein QYS47_31985 [Marivirga sp. BKB1-2]